MRAITGRDQERLDAAVAEIDPHASGLRCDAADLDGIDRPMQTVQAERGQIDVLLASAGSWTHGPL